MGPRDYFTRGALSKNHLKTSLRFVAVVPVTSSKHCFCQIRMDSSEIAEIAKLDGVGSSR